MAVLYCYTYIYHYNECQAFFPYPLPSASGQRALVASWRKLPFHLMGVQAYPPQRTAKSWLVAKRKAIRTGCGKSEGGFRDLEFLLKRGEHPNAATSPVHDRMPVILDPDGYDLWLDPGMRNVTLASELLRPYTVCWPRHGIGTR